MILTEFYATREDGVRLVRSVSDKGVLIERDGVRYGEAIDPEDAKRVYTETDEPIEQQEGMPGEITDREALQIIVGGGV